MHDKNMFEFSYTSFLSILFLVLPCDPSEWNLGVFANETPNPNRGVVKARRVVIYSLKEVLPQASFAFNSNNSILTPQYNYRILGIMFLLKIKIKKGYTHDNWQELACGRPCTNKVENRRECQGGR